MYTRPEELDGKWIVKVADEEYGHGEFLENVIYDLVWSERRNVYIFLSNSNKEIYKWSGCRLWRISLDTPIPGSDTITNPIIKLIGTKRIDGCTHRIYIEISHSPTISSYPRVETRFYSVITILQDSQHGDEDACHAHDSTNGAGHIRQAYHGHEGKAHTHLD